ncbi:MAG: hypothetical protein AB1609_00170 [Bacillota bacterium]
MGQALPEGGAKIAVWWRRAAAIALAVGAVGLWMRAAGQRERDRARGARRLFTLVNV